MPVVEFPVAQRLRTLRTQTKRRARGAIVASVAAHALLALSFQRGGVWPASERAHTLGYEGPLRVVNLAPLEQVVSDQERVAERRALAGALRSAQVAHPRSAPKAVEPAPRPGDEPRAAPVSRPVDEPVVVFLSDDWSRAVSTSVPALSEEFQTLTVVRPVYPVQAVQEEREGVVELEVIVSESGLVDEVRVRRSPSHGLLLEQAASDAMVQWRFRPMRRDGRPVRFTVVVPFRFRLIG